VATRTVASGTDDQWIDGETALSCCPSGFVADNTGACSPGSSGTWPVVQCGEADAEENELRTYTAGSWPAGATARVPVLQLRFQATDTDGAPLATSSSSGNGNSSNGKGSSGLSTATKAALGTVIPLIVLLGTLAFFLLWRRRKNRAASVKAAEEEHLYPKSAPLDTTAYSHSGASPLPPAGAYAHPQLSTVPDTALPLHETPEWNVEMDAVEAERRQYTAVQGSVFPAATAAAAEKSTVEVAELGGLARVARKPIAPVEIDSEPWRGEREGGDGRERGT
jgi:hypothetical protein